MFSGVSGSTTSDEIWSPVSPVFTAVQWPPLLVDRKTPALLPRYRVEGVTGLMARQENAILHVVSPVFTGVHVVPLFVDR